MKKKPAMWVRVLRWISPTWWFRRCAPLYLKDANNMREAYTLKVLPAGVELRAIPGVDSDKYQAGDDGNIWSFSQARTNARKPCPYPLSASSGANGYPHVTLIQDGRYRPRSVHSLICLAFKGPKPSPAHEVRHLDGSRTNTRPDNLEWGTPAENEADKRRHGTVACGERHGTAKLTEEAVRILRIAIPAGLWNPTDAAKVFGVDPSAIRAAVRGENWQHVNQEDVA